MEKVANPPPPGTDSTAPTRPVLHVLLVEDSPSDLELVRDLLSGDPRLGFVLTHAVRLADALALLRGRNFDAVLLDLGLPDSQGVDTFVQLHAAAPEVPIVVLSANDDDETGISTMQSGAEEFLLKREAQAAFLRNSIRFTVIRAGARQAREQSRQRDDQTRELRDMDRLSRPASTAVSARIYSGTSLHEHGPEEFNAAVAEYGDLVAAALERRMFKVEGDPSERVRELGTQLGFLRCSPRDLVEIHATALRKLTTEITAPKARALLEEGRLMLLELMGHLTSYYRSYYTATKHRESKS